MIFISGPSKETVNLIVINGKKDKLASKELREVICREAFNSWQEGTFSNYYFHPDVVTYIENSNLKIKDVEKFYFKMEGRDICRVVVKRAKGFSAFQAIVSKDGQLIYRVTSIKAEKPTYSEIKDYL